MQNLVENERYPGLPALDYARRYLDGFFSIVEAYMVTFSTILLTVGISFSMFDFLSGGTALNNPLVFNSWAIVQTIAIDSQFINLWYRVKVARKNKKHFQAIGYIFLGLILAFVSFGASLIPSLQKSLNLSFNDAVYSAGINPVIMVWARSFVAILLAVIGAFQREVIVFKTSGEIVQKIEVIEQAEIAEESEQIPEEKRANLLARFLAFLEVKIMLRNWGKRAQIEQEPEQKLIEKPEQNTRKNTDDLTPDYTPVSAPTFNRKITQELPEFHPEISPETDTKIVAVSAPKSARKLERKTYSFSEVSKWDICTKNNVEIGDIRAAVSSGHLKRKANGKLTKNAVETWLKNREKSEVKV